MKFDTFETIPDPENARNDIRYIKTPGGNKIYFKFTDPYGFIQISFDRGAVPPILKQSFTNLEAAYIVVENYLATRPEHLWDKSEKQTEKLDAKRTEPKTVQRTFGRQTEAEVT